MTEDSYPIAENRGLGEGYHLMKIDAPALARSVEPGHFVMVKVSAASAPLLKRPLGILRADPPHIWLYFHVVGPGTRLLAGMRSGEFLTMLGPLGKPFPSFSGRNILIVAGGIGIVPVLFAARRLRKTNRITFLYGAQSVDHLYLDDDVSSLSLHDAIFYTDDGSAGKKGLVTEDVAEIIKRDSIDTVLACGPDPMFKALDQLLAGLKIDAYVSLEALMGCGFGICHSCVVMTRQGSYKKVCSDGPVFRLEEIKW